DEEDDVFAYAGDDRLAIGHIIRHDPGKDSPDWTAQVLHIVPILPVQHSVLSVVVGPPIRHSDCNGFYWTWRHRDLAGDGIPEIESGTRTSNAGDITPRAVYGWVKETSRYEGPSGSVEAGFVRLDATRTVDGCCAGGKRDCAIRDGATQTLDP